MERQEAQAIILAAGPGMRMSSLTAKTPKCLLPVGTLPMIYYPLVKLQDAGFKEVTVVVSEGVERDIQKLVEQYDLKLCLDIVKVTTGDDPGTMDSLRMISNRIKKNVDEVVIASCDLISDVPLLPIINRHYEHGGCLTMLAGSEKREMLSTDPPVPGPKSKTTICPDIIGYQDENKQLAYSVVGGDYGKVINIGGKMKAKLPGRINLSCALLDGHLYIMKRWVFNYILNEKSPCKNMGSLKAEIIPHLIKCQFDTGNENYPNLLSYAPVSEYEDLIKKFNTSTIDSIHKRGTKRQKSDSFLYEHTGIVTRLNTIKTYWQANTQINKIFKSICPKSYWDLRHETADVQPKAQVSEDTVIGMSAIIKEKTNVTSSVIGNHCKINSFCRISNSVLAPYVNVVEGCVIDNCLIFANIEKKCTLKNCIVTDPNRITENMTATNELIEASQDYTA